LFDECTLYTPTCYENPTTIATWSPAFIFIVRLLSLFSQFTTQV